MEIKKKLSQSIINKIRNSPTTCGLAFEYYGKSSNIKDYSDKEITEMKYGIYKDTKMLLVDGDYFIDLMNVVESICTLKTVTYYKNPTLEDYKTNAHNTIDNIRTFYVKDYFLITKDPVNGIAKHRITRFLHKLGVIKNGRTQFRGLFSISNDHKTLQAFNHVDVPKDLFLPIKFYINGLFFNDDYYISNFQVQTEIKIEKGF